jgi:hypothetical protein
VVDTILASTTRLIANRAAWADPAKRTKIEDVALLLQGAIEGRDKVGLKLNVHKDALKNVKGGWAGHACRLRPPLHAAPPCMTRTPALLRANIPAAWATGLCVDSPNQQPNMR